MGLFDWLFGKKDKQPTRKAPPTRAKKQTPPKANQRKQNYFLTNSGEFEFGEIELGIAGKLRVDAILAIAALEKKAKTMGKHFEYQVMYVSLLEDGALTVPLVFTFGEKKYTAYFIYQEEEFLKYKDLVKQVTRTAYPNLIYFSSIPIYDGYTPKPIIEPFQLADLRYEKSAKVAGEFAMWWSEEGEMTFHDSKTCEHLTKMFEVFKGYETYLTGYIMRQTRIVNEQQLQRMKMPENHVNYVLHAPDNKKVILDISQEKGIRFLFQKDNTSKEYRERFLKGALVDFLATRISLQQQKAPQDEPWEPNSYDWFNFMVRVIKKKEIEGNADVSVIGGGHFNSQLN